MTDTAYLHPEADDLVNRTTSTSACLFDAGGNARITSVEMVKTEDGTVETFAKEVENFYDNPQAALEGKPTKTIVTASGGTRSTTHTTTFDYAPVSTFGGISSRVALAKKHIEPEAGWPTQLDTAYKYDKFGNVTITTTCASDFGTCSPGASNPATASDPIHHPPFRTITVSYDPSVLATPVSYKIGRFPTQTTNAVGHMETTVYDPILGKILTKTGPNNIQTCYAYDALGRQTSTTDRCNSATPLTTTTRYFLTNRNSNACNAQNTALLTFEWVG